MKIAIILVKTAIRKQIYKKYSQKLWQNIKTVIWTHFSKVFVKVRCWYFILNKMLIYNEDLYPIHSIYHYI